MSQRLTRTIFCTGLICFCMCPLLRADSFTLSQSGLMALDFSTGTNGTLLLNRVLSGGGVEYENQFPRRAEWVDASPLGQYRQFAVVPILAV